MPSSAAPNASSLLLFAELAWNSSDDAFGAALEGIASGKVYADDANADVPAPGCGVLNLRAQARQQAGRWQFSQFVRLNNLADRDYVGSVIVGDANKRYYEAAPGRSWLAGVSARYQF